MKREWPFLVILLMAVALLSVQSSHTQSCVRLFKPGFDQFGYNYTAHIFRGTYDTSDRTIDDTYWGSTGDYVDDRLIMKWSDDWLTDVDCNGDGKLDRGGPGGAGISKGWLTNHVVGDYLDPIDGSMQQYEWFVKIVYMDTTKYYAMNGNWYDAATNELIGPQLWGAYCIIQEVYNDTGAHQHGVTWKASRPGFGFYEKP